MDSYARLDCKKLEAKARQAPHEIIRLGLRFTLHEEQKGGKEACHSSRSSARALTRPPPRSARIAHRRRELLEAPHIIEAVLRRRRRRREPLRRRNIRDESDGTRGRSGESDRNKRSAASRADSDVVSGELASSSSSEPVSASVRRAQAASASASPERRPSGKPRIASSRGSSVVGPGSVDGEDNGSSLASGAPSSKPPARSSRGSRRASAIRPRPRRRLYRQPR